MSLKKDNYKSLDKKIMNFAINLAENNKYLTGTNPSVGCVIVRKNMILSFATTNYGGHTIVAAVHNKNITGLQFHPEKSGHIGLKILENF